MVAKHGWTANFLLEVTVKSHESDQMTLIAQLIYFDACAKCGVVPESRDAEVIAKRTEDEGLSFLTITLPSLCSDIEMSFEDGCISASSFRSFKKDGRIPAFLRGIIREIFDQDTGILLNGDVSNYVEAVRQICLTFKKILIPCSEKRNKIALREFKQIEQDFNEEIIEDVTKTFKKFSDHVWFNINCSLHLIEAVPRHGPGATADRRANNQKFDPAVEWYERLEPFFPPDSYIQIGVECGNDLKYKSIPPEDERPVKVTLVPKTLKSPRIIAIEPTCMQYTQQALSSLLVKRLESDPLTKGHINFKDQSVNQVLAARSSVDKSFATLDLSSASDRVPLDLALVMFDQNPDFRDAVKACRSTKAMLPDGEILHLRKFASMGSALCFPIEAMYFYTICVIALYKATKLPVCHASLCKIASMIYVYGDDILVPTDYAPVVIDHLHLYRCKVNKRKSFYKSNFRESCGADCYYGESVTPVYIRTCQPIDKRNARELISHTSTANQFYLKGYWRVARHMFGIIESILGPLPYVRRDSPGLGRFSFRGYLEYSRYSKASNKNANHYSRPEIRLYVPSPVYYPDELEGDGALVKCLLSPYKPIDLMKIDGKDQQHLSRSARYGTVTLKRRWVSAFY